MKRGNCLQLTFAGSLGRQPRAVAFQRSSRLVDFANLSAPVLAHYPAMPLACNQSLSRQSLQALPDGRAAHRKPLGELNLNEPLVGACSSGYDRFFYCLTP
jgi:hypothetical protein